MFCPSVSLQRISIVPLRMSSAPIGFGCTWNCSVADPLVLALETTLTHGTFGFAVQLWAPWVSTATLAVAPAAGTRSNRTGPTEVRHEPYAHFKVMSSTCVSAVA